MTSKLTPHVVKGMGWKRQRLDPLDKKLMLAAPVGPLKDVDLREFGPPIMDQGDLGTCVTFGTTRAMRHSIKRVFNTDIPLSCLQLYVDARKLESTSLTEDSGLEIRDALKCAERNGIAHDSLWPYYPAKFSEEPPPSVYQDALLNQCLLYETVKVSTRAMVAALASGVPIIIGLMLYESFKHVGANGLVRMPDPQREKQLGGHCMVVEGYRKKDSTFIIANSWNTTWGDKGYGYFPARYLANDLYASDFWVVRLVEGFTDTDMAKKLKEWITNPTASVTEGATHYIKG